MAQKERNLTNDRLLNLSPDERLFRINAGMGWAGEVVQHTGQIIILKNPNPLHAAPTGWPDLCGWTQKIITLSDVGQKIAVFTGEEVKASGKLSKEQRDFKDLIERMGGVFNIVNS